ncbi:MAG: hypothetical protein RLZZ232_2592 [Planctomycetota bacterium]
MVVSVVSPVMAIFIGDRSRGVDQACKSIQFRLRKAAGRLPVPSVTEFASLLRIYSIRSWECFTLTQGPL